MDSAALRNTRSCPSNGSTIRLSDELRVYEYDQADELRERLKEVIAQQLGVDKSKVTGDLSVLKDFGADSLDVVELVMELEEEFGLDDLPEG